MNFKSRKAAQPQLPSIALPRTHVNSASENGDYMPEWVPVRPGSQDHENLPSRRVVTREWRDGRVEQA